MQVNQDCINNPLCTIYRTYQTLPRPDCPEMCDDGCIYGDDCEKGTPPPVNIIHVHLPEEQKISSE